MNGLTIWVGLVNGNNHTLPKFCHTLFVKRQTLHLQHASIKQQNAQREHC